MDVSVLTVTHGNPALTRACLSSVTRDLTDLEGELIVVDSASPDETPDVIADEFPHVRLIRLEDNVGFARANNIGAREARGDHLLLLNPDTVVHQGAIRALVELARRRPEGGLYGGRTLTPDGALDPRSCWGAPTLWSTFCFATGLSTLLAGSRLFNPESLGGWARDTEREVGVVTGCLALIRRDLWERLGGFDADFFMYSEDVDLSLRVAKLGYRPCISNTATITHVAGASSGDDGKKLTLLLRGKASVMRRHWSPAKARVGVALLLCGTALRAAGQRVLSRPGPWRQAWRERGRWRVGYASTTPH